VEVFLQVCFYGGFAEALEFTRGVLLGELFGQTNAAGHDDVGCHTGGGKGSELADVVAVRGPFPGVDVGLAKESPHRVGDLDICWHVDLAKPICRLGGCVGLVSTERWR